MNLSLGLKTIAKRFPGRPAVEWEGGTLTYSEFECQVSELAYSLQHYHGLRKGAKIAMAMENCAEFLVILFAIWRADMTAIPLNSKLHPGCNFEFKGIAVMSARQIAKSLSLIHI